MRCCGRWGKNWLRLWQKLGQKEAEEERFFYRNFEKADITRLSFLDKGRQAWDVEDRHPQRIHHAGMTHDPYIIVMAGLLPAAPQSTHPVYKVASLLKLHLATRLLTVRSVK